MVESQVLAARRVAIHTVTGELTLQVMLGAMRDLYADPTFQSDFGVVWDLRQGDIKIALREIIYLDSAIVDFANENRPAGKLAWVPATAFGETIIQMLYREHPWAQDWRTFTSLDAALDWTAG